MFHELKYLNFFKVSHTSMYCHHFKLFSLHDSFLVLITFILMSIISDVSSNDNGNLWNFPISLLQRNSMIKYLCDNPVIDDIVSGMGSYMYLFKDKYVYRCNQDGKILEAVPISAVWDVPCPIIGVFTVLTKDRDGSTICFVNNDKKWFHFDWSGHLINKGDTAEWLNCPQDKKLVSVMSGHNMYDKSCRFVYQEKGENNEIVGYSVSIAEIANIDDMKLLKCKPEKLLLFNGQNGHYIDEICVLKDSLAGTKTIKDWMDIRAATFYDMNNIRYWLLIDNKGMYCKGKGYVIQGKCEKHKFKEWLQCTWLDSFKSIIGKPFRLKISANGTHRNRPTTSHIPQTTSNDQTTTESTGETIIQGSITAETKPQGTTERIITNQTTANGTTTTKETSTTNHQVTTSQDEGI